MKNTFRMAESKLHFCKSLYSVTSTKVTKKKKIIQEKIPVQPRILTALLFIGSRPCSLMINEDWPYLLTCSQTEVNEPWGGCKRQSTAPAGQTHGSRSLHVHPVQGGSQQNLLQHGRDPKHHVFPYHSCISRWEGSAYLTPCCSSTCSSTLFWSIRRNNQVNAQWLCANPKAQPHGTFTWAQCPCRFCPRMSFFVIGK